jgi:hypothetical protein
MTEIKRHKKPLKTIHRILIMARWKAYQEENCYDIGRMLDVAENLIITLADKDTGEQRFVEQLRLLTDQYNLLHGLLEEYEKSDSEN